MRCSLLMLMSLALSACGDGGTDFSVDVDMAQPQAIARLMALDGGTMHRMAGMAPLHATNPEPGQLRYVFLDEQGSEAGTLVLILEAIDANNTRIHAALDLSAVRYSINGEDRVVSEARAESMLEGSLSSWAQELAENGHASLDQVNESLAAFAIVMQPSRIESFSDPETVFAWMDAEVSADSGGFADDISYNDNDWGAGTETEVVNGDGFDTYAKEADDSWDGEAEGY